MKPAPFEYHDPTTVAEATALLAQYGDDCRPLAGGQSLIPMLALRLANFPHVVDLGRVTELRNIVDKGSSISVGAMVRQSEIEHSALIREKLPLLAEASRYIGHFQIRSRGTIGGSLAHADAAAEYPAVSVALGAQFQVKSESDSRSVEAADFFEGFWMTTLEGGELLCEVEFPIGENPTSTGFAEISRRPGDFATAGAAAQLTWNGDSILGGRLSIFGAGSRPTLHHAEELGLVGSTATTADVAAAVETSASGLSPLEDLHGSMTYKMGVARIVVRDALVAAISGRQK